MRYLPRSVQIGTHRVIDWWFIWSSNLWEITWGEWRFNSGNPYKAYKLGPLNIRYFNYKRRK